MKIFISWSGDLSRKVAERLREWLPNVIQTVEPYLSAKDIEKGSAWFTDISRGLKASDFGIICLTRENLESTWIHFEAGAVANMFEMNRTSCLLVDLAHPDVKPPLSQFQHTLPTHDDMLVLMQTLNKHTAARALKTDQLRKAFDKWWPDFEREMQRILEDTGPRTPGPVRTDTELLEEILELSRRTARLIDTTRSERGLRMPSRRRWRKLKHSALTLLILYLNHMLDTGKYDDITIDEVLEEIDQGTIVQFLVARGGSDMDLSVHLAGTYGDFESFLVKNYQSFYDAYGGGGKWRVENKGICLLLAWTNEIVQQGTGWQASGNFSER